MLRRTLPTRIKPKMYSQPSSLLQGWTKWLIGSSGTTIAIFLTSLAIIPAIAQHLDPLAQLPVSTQTILRDGKVIVNGINGQYTGRVLVKAPMTTVWAVLTDYNNFKTFMPNVESSKLLSSHGNQRIFEQVNVAQILAFKFQSRLHIAATESYPKQIVFKAIDGDIKSLEGLWKLNSVVAGNHNQVLITHNVKVEPGSGNRDLYLRLYKTGLESTLVSIKQEVERRVRRN
jgi:ribosome-associated toxin RatA of RatAB toxin-antitoxin module